MSQHADGRIELFIIATLANAMTRATQSAPNSSTWGPEQDLDIYGRQLAPVIGANGEIALIYLQMNNEIACVRQTTANSASWSKSKALDLYASYFTVGAQEDGRLELVLVGTLGNVLTHATETAPGSNAWGKEIEFKGLYGHHPRLGRSPDGALTFFLLTMDRQLTYVRQTAANSADWGTPVKTKIYGNDIYVGQDAAGRFEIGIIGTMANALSHVSQLEANTDKWSEERDLKGYVKQLEMPNNADGALQLISIIALGNQIYHSSQL